MSKEVTIQIHIETDLKEEVQLLYQAMGKRL